MDPIAVIAVAILIAIGVFMVRALLWPMWRPGDPYQCPLCLHDYRSEKCPHPWDEKPGWEI